MYYTKFITFAAPYREKTITDAFSSMDLAKENLRKEEKKAESQLGNGKIIKWISVIKSATGVSLYYKERRK